MSELLPCPFCGGEAVFNADPNTKGGYDYCGSCPACDFSLDARATGAEAIAAWNRRAFTHPQPALISDHEKDIPNG